MSRASPEDSTTRGSLIVKATVALAAAIDGNRLHSASATTIEPAPCSARLTLMP